jgi:hypothetical protein
MRRRPASLVPRGRGKAALHGAIGAGEMPLHVRLWDRAVRFRNCIPLLDQPVAADSEASASLRREKGGDNTCVREKP